jgi:hypothetical protein
MTRPRPIFRRAPRLAALAFGVILVGAVEVFCRGAGIGDHRDRPDPFAGLTGLQPLFRKAVGPDGTKILRTGEGASERRFLAIKPPNGFRVFVFGGSSEVGTPYGYEYSFARFLQSLLAAALPSHAVEVVNCAVPGFASRRLLYAAREVSAYEPDLYIVSTGHNELVEQRLYGHLVGASPWLFELQQRVRALRTYVLFEDAVRAVANPARPQIEGDKIYVPMFGPMASKFWQDEPRDAARQRYYALAMFRANVDAMIRAAERAGAAALVLSQPKNYAG